MQDLLSIIKKVTINNNIFIDILNESINIIHGDDNSELESQNKKIRAEIITRDSDYLLFKEAMAKYNFSKVDEIPRPDDMSKEEFDELIQSFKTSVIAGKEKMDEYFKVFSIEYNMINKIQCLGSKNKLDIKF